MLRRTIFCLKNAKKTSSHNKRTQHSFRWFTKAKSNPLSAKSLEERSHTPHTPAFSEEVDRPYVIPADAKCFNCKGTIQHKIDPNGHVWVPSGNAAAPTKAGYFFHHGCFKCPQCGFRFFNNKFFSQGDRAVCVHCAMGKNREYPHRRWHTSYVAADRYNSRLSGHQFPRHQSQMEFLYDPEA